jgi:NADPH:quinone reductase-like Zn-dependent oxidoreductase
VLSLVSGQSFRPVVVAEKPADLRALAELLECGEVAPVVDRTFTLPEAPDALRHLEEGHPRRQGRRDGLSGPVGQA